MKHSLMRLKNFIKKDSSSNTNCKFCTSLYNLGEWVVISFSTLIIVYLSTLVYRYTFNSYNSIPQQSNVLLQICIILFAGLLCWLIGHLLNRYTRICKYISLCALLFTCVFVGIVSLTFVNQTLILPGSDPLACCILAEQFSQSDFSTVVPTDSYLSLWPFQLSFIFVLEKIMRLFQTTDPIIFQQMNCLYLLMIIISGYGIICSMTRRLEAHLLYLFLMATYLPLIFRVYEIYGDVPSLAWIFLSYCSLLYYSKATRTGTKILFALLFASSTILAVIYKSNSLIYVIAILLVSLVQQLRKRNLPLLVLVCFIFLLTINTSSLFQKYYESYANNVCGKGVPAVAYIAMGLQYNGEEAIPGGWNGFHSNTYMATNYNYDETVRLSKESIALSLDTFKEDPSFMIHFFNTKVLKQWANQSHGLYWNMNSMYDTTRDPNSYWVHHLESGQYQNLLAVMDIHESLIYSIFLLTCLLLIMQKSTKKEINFHLLIPFIYFIGGFLFSLIWEGQTDAVMYYPVLLLPVAIGLLCSHLEHLYS